VGSRNRAEINFSRGFFWLVLALLVHGCATQPPGATPPVEDRAPPEVAAPSPRPSMPVIDRLLADAQSQYQSGQVEQAIATAERGLRIDRRVPELYLVLARGYRRLNNPDQARQFAEQGLRYVADRSDPTAEELRFLLSRVVRKPRCVSCRSLNGSLNDSKLSHLFH